jgi:hypothetical protein
MAMAKLQVQTMTWLLVIVLNTGTITLPQPSKNHCLGAMATAIDRAYHAAKDRGEFRVYSAQCVAEIFGDDEPRGRRVFRRRVAFCLARSNLPRSVSFSGPKLPTRASQEVLGTAAVMPTSSEGNPCEEFRTIVRTFER